MITLSKNQKLHVIANGGACVCGDSALDLNGLIYSGPFIIFQTFIEDLNNFRVCDVVLQYYHFDDDYYLSRHNDNVYLPTAERAVIDAVAFLDRNYNEGALVEALQNYIRRNTDGFAKLYEVANHYNVPISDVDYWINEAREESDMSMG